MSEIFGCASSKEWVESAPPNWNWVNVSAKNWAPASQTVVFKNPNMQSEFLKIPFSFSSHSKIYQYYATK